MGAHDPRHEMHWDGHAVHARCAGSMLALHVDGSQFVRWARTDGQSLRQEFPFSPSGHACMQLQLVVDGVALGVPLEASMGCPGLHAADSAPQALAPLAEASEQRLASSALAHVAAVRATIIVPIHNAAAAFARCLSSIQHEPADRVRVLLIDDASDEAAIQPLLAEAAHAPHVHVLRNAANLGFTATVNRGLQLCDGDDVVLLNADTEVGPGWLGGLRRAAYSAPDIASATAVSDNAGAFSVPELEFDNPLPGGWNHVDAARALLQGAGLNLPQLPTGNGFCMYLRAEALEQIGLLDAHAFAQGYGEENDWCQRAEQLGWRHLIAGHVFVAHARSQSFGEERRRLLGQQGMHVLRQRYPGYEAAVGVQLHGYRRQVLDWRVRRLWAAGISPRPRHLRIGGRFAASPLVELWQVRIESAACLLDHAGNIRERCATTALCDELLAWLQRHGFESASGERDGLDSETLCAALGIKYFRT